MSFQPIQEPPLSTAKDVTVKTGTVTSVVSSNVLLLEDAVIVELIGVKPGQSAATLALAKWAKGKQVRVAFLAGRKGYVFVFPNELECYCVNLELVREGALAVDTDTSVYAHRVLLAAQKTAQEKRLGIWGESEEAKNETRLPGHSK